MKKSTLLAVAFALSSTGTGAEQHANDGIQARDYYEVIITDEEMLYVSPDRSSSVTTTMYITSSVYVDLVDSTTTVTPSTLARELRAPRSFPVSLPSDYTSVPSPSIRPSTTTASSIPSFSPLPSLPLGYNSSSPIHEVTRRSKAEVNIDPIVLNIDKVTDAIKNIDRAILAFTGDVKAWSIATENLLDLESDGTLLFHDSRALEVYEARTLRPQIEKLLMVQRSVFNHQIEKKGVFETAGLCDQVHSTFKWQAVKSMKVYVSFLQQLIPITETGIIELLEVIVQPWNEVVWSYDQRYCYDM